MASKPKEDHDAHEATCTRRDRGQAAPGRWSGRARNPGGRCDPRDRGHRGHRLRDELLDGEIFYTLQEAKVVIERWRRHDNSVRPHASLGYRPPAPEVFVPAFIAWPAAPPRPAPPARPSLAQRPTLMEWMPSPGNSALCQGDDGPIHHGRKGHPCIRRPSSELTLPREPSRRTGRQATGGLRSGSSPRALSCRRFSLSSRGA